MTKFKNYESFSMGRMLPSLFRNASSSIFGSFIQVDFCAFTDEIRISVPSLQARFQCGILLSTLHHHQKTTGFAAITECGHHFCALFHFSAVSHYLWDEHFLFYFAQWFVFRITYKKKCCWKKTELNAGKAMLTYAMRSPAEFAWLRVRLIGCHCFEQNTLRRLIQGSFRTGLIQPANEPTICQQNMVKMKVDLVEPILERMISALSIFNFESGNLFD